MMHSAAVDLPGQPSLLPALRRFGLESLRPGQEEIIRDVLDGHPVVAVMPTGAGKSLCYQLPAAVLAEEQGLTLVISPLIALMKDQVDGLRDLGIAAHALTSAASFDEQREMLEAMRNRKLTLLYVAPERFKSPRFMEALAELGDSLQLVAIDEAHCISEWGHDFRPEYRRIGEVLKNLAPPRIAAFTATATPRVRADIAAQLGMQSPKMHVRGFDRQNLHFVVERIDTKKGKTPRMVELVKQREGGVALVFAGTRKNAEAYADALKANKLKVRFYHAGLDDGDRTKAQDTFMAGKLDVIVATNAFGMGVDKSDIRLVVHADVPKSVEAYYQEAGRGGRDGMPTKCVLLFNHADVRLQELLIDANFPSGELLRAAWKLLRDDPSAGDLDGLEDRLKQRLPGSPHGVVISSILRILERHGLVRFAGGQATATRPEAGVAQLDPEALARRKDVEHDKLKAMVGYAYGTGCRRRTLLEYFGDQAFVPDAAGCGACDACLAIGSAPLMSESAQVSVIELLGLISALKGRFGRTRIANLAIGSDRDPRFTELEGRSCLAGSSASEVLDFLSSLEQHQLIESRGGEYPTIGLTRKGSDVLSGATKIGEIGLRAPSRPRPSPKSSVRKRVRRRSP